MPRSAANVSSTNNAPRVGGAGERHRRRSPTQVEVVIPEAREIARCCRKRDAVGGASRGGDRFRKPIERAARAQARPSFSRATSGAMHNTRHRDTGPQELPSTGHVLAPQRVRISDSTVIFGMLVARRASVKTDRLRRAAPQKFSPNLVGIRHDLGVCCNHRRRRQTRHTLISDSYAAARRWHALCE
jgi:hypothetical protein